MYIYRYFFSVVLSIHVYNTKSKICKELTLVYNYNGLMESVLRSNCASLLIQKDADVQLLYCSLTQNTIHQYI